jgi:hypothetical protein
MIENLHVVGLLEAILGDRPLPDPLRVLDVGAKDWHYLPGLDRFLRRVGRSAPRSLALTGIELDPYWRYPSGFSRFDYARHYQTFAPDSRYLMGDVREHAGSYDLTLALYPFWRLGEVLDWGLPASAHDPVRFWSHLQGLTAPGGRLVATAYPGETATAEALWTELGWVPEGAGAWRSPFIPGRPHTWWTFRWP